MNPLSRYHRQSILPEIGSDGQKRITESSVAVVGLGALGSVSANLLARAGAGKLRLIDRDFLELNNLQRQVLFDEEDFRANLPKAIAAERKLTKINSGITIKGHAADLNVDSIDELLGGVDLVLDGTDNFETRFLVNDFCLREGIPWIYGGAVGTEGRAYVILPGEGPCLRCLFEEAPRPGEFQTCDTAGILAPAAHWIASFQVTEALKLLAGRKEAVDRRLWKMDIWRGEVRTIDVGTSPFHPPPAEAGGGAEGSRQCSGCQRREYPYLARERGTRTVTLCGRNAVQILGSEKTRIDFHHLAQKLFPLGAVKYNEYLLRASVNPYEITVFPNGRAVIRGTEDASQAKSVYAKYIGG